MLILLGIFCMLVSVFMYGFSHWDPLYLQSAALWAIVAAISEQKWRR